MAVEVRYDHSENIWNEVIVDAGEDEDPTVIHEDGIHFIAEYPSEDHFQRALSRFEGMIDHEVLVK